MRGRRATPDFAINCMDILRPRLGDSRGGIVGEHHLFAMDTRQGRHIFPIYETRDGFRTEVRTRVSHQSGGGDVSDSLVAAMARQVKLSRRELEQLV
jgi:hypothetical protein